MSNADNLKQKLYKEELVRIEYSLKDEEKQKISEAGRRLEKMRI